MISPEHGRVWQSRLLGQKRTDEWVERRNRLREELVLKYEEHGYTGTCKERQDMFALFTWDSVERGPRYDNEHLGEQFKSRLFNAVVTKLYRLLASKVLLHMPFQNDSQLFRISKVEVVRVNNAPNQIELSFGEEHYNFELTMIVPYPIELFRSPFDDVWKAISDAYPEDQWQALCMGLHTRAGADSAVQRASKQWNFESNVLSLIRGFMAKPPSLKKKRKPAVKRKREES